MMIHFGEYQEFHIEHHMICQSRVNLPQEPPKLTCFKTLKTFGAVHNEEKLRIV